MQPLVLRFVQPRLVEVHEQPLPVAGPDEALVRTLYSGISPGTEMLAYRGEIDPDLPLDESIGSLGGTFSYPFEYGYSAAGVVETGTEGVSAGTRVFSFQPHRSHFVARREDLVVAVDIDARSLTLFPLVETALQISLDAGEVQGRDVVVVGLGPVGILAGALLRRGGASVIGTDPLPWKRMAASRFGFDSVSPDEIGDVVGRHSPGGAHLLIEASGNPDALASSLSLVAHEGTVLVCSWFGTKPVALPLGAEFHRRRLTIASSQVSTIPQRLQGEWTFDRRREVALELMRELPLSELASHTFPVRDAGLAYSAIDRAEEGLIHAALSYD
jgi:2-desacetyl-2-hydroxyethyl bacteriochlorophyllide A dehydrogenase